jgi:hypothetical protein
VGRNWELGGGGIREGGGKELGRRDARGFGEAWEAEFGGRCERDLDEGVGGDSGEGVEDNSEGESREGVGGDSVRGLRRSWTKMWEGIRRKV